MESRFDDNEFEQFLQEQTNQHRMYPSDKVWRNIHAKLHGHKSWPALTVLGLLIVCALTISTLLYNHPATPADIVNLTPTPTVATQQSASAPQINFTYQEHFFANNINQKTFDILKSKEHQHNLAELEAALATANPLAASVTDAAIEKVTLYHPHMVEATRHSSDVGKNLASQEENMFSIVKKRLQQNQLTPGTEVSSIQANTIEEAAVRKIATLSTLDLAKRKELLFVKKPKDDHPTEALDDIMGLRIPSLNKRRGSKFSYEVYITPSISYRKLVDDKERNKFTQRVAAPLASNGSIDVNVNDVVRHKPAIGTEIGVGFKYKLNQKLKIVSGLQFNIRQYFIDAYASNGDLATIAIVSNNRLDTVSQYSSFSNTGGYSQSKLDTKLYQIALPIGVEWSLLQTKRFGVNVGASVQPTLTLNKNLYIISTDYTRYTDGTPFFRRWNINSSASLNFSYRFGSTSLQLGPQIRYQHLPTYSEQYPIKEYRLDYGIRIGLIKSF
jgi:hypothetical protein